MALYLGSVFILLAIIGYLFFENNTSMIMSSTKYEMMYQARKISSQIIMTAMQEDKIDREHYLKNLKHCRFDIGYYDDQKRDLYSEIPQFTRFDQSFFVEGSSCYAVMEDPSNHLGVHYIVLKESNLSREIQKLRMKIIGYLILSFIFMGVVGYFLGRLFLAPVRNKIESLDRFISDTTHELNTPISAILMTIQTLKGCDPRKLKRLEASAKRLNMMYGSMTYRLQEDDKEQTREKVLMSDLVEERVEYVKELIEAKHLKIELNLEILTVIMNTQSAERLIDNLLSNAIKYSDPGGKISISIKGNRLSVADEGIGIDTDAKRDIFKRYKRANKERGGFGIGLDIVLTICKRNGIGIELESEKGKGSRFTLLFPVSKRS